MTFSIKKINMLLKKISAILFALVLLIHFNACDNSNDTTELFWHITECKDPWWVENVDQTTKPYRDLMTQYLLTRDIIVKDHFLVQNAEADDESCTGCGCKTSFRIRALILNDDVADAKALGFEEE